MSAYCAAARTEAFALDRKELQRLIAKLSQDGYRLLAPTRESCALAVGPVDDLDAVASQWLSEVAPGAAGPTEEEGIALLPRGLPALGWKETLYPPRERLFRARREADGIAFEREGDVEAPIALLGVRACDLAAMVVLDRVLGGEPPVDGRFRRRRQTAFIVGVTCVEPAATCFCASMGTGPKVGPEADVVLTALPPEEGAVVVASAQSARGAGLLDGLGAVPATVRQMTAAEEVVERARGRLSRQMHPGIAGILSRQAESARWQEIGRRCLACGNCTAVCPTCFCSTIEDGTDLAGSSAERWRRWDSCFTLAFSFLHGGSVRSSIASRYRQWMTHKLSNWWEQFGSSGCVGCGRCIAWCPVGIDITAEAAAFAALDPESGR